MNKEHQHPISALQQFTRKFQNILWQPASYVVGFIRQYGIQMIV